MTQNITSTLRIEISLHSALKVECGRPLGRIPHTQCTINYTMFTLVIFSNGILRTPTKDVGAQLLLFIYVCMDPTQIDLCTYIC